MSRHTSAPSSSSVSFREFNLGLRDLALMSEIVKMFFLVVLCIKESLDIEDTDKSSLITEFLRLEVNEESSLRD